MHWVNHQTLAHVNPQMLVKVKIMRDIKCYRRLFSLGKPSRVIFVLPKIVALLVSSMSMPRGVMLIQLLLSLFFQCSQSPTPPYLTCYWKWSTSITKYHCLGGPYREKVEGASHVNELVPKIP